MEEEILYNKKGIKITKIITDKSITEFYLEIKERIIKFTQDEFDDMLEPLMRERFD